MYLCNLMFMFLCFKTSLGFHKQLCYNDDECLINAVITRVYPMFVAGMPGVESSDPLHLDAIVADLPTIKYSLYNATLVGMKNCQFEKLSNERLTEYTKFNYELQCQELTLSSEYELNGLIDSVPVEGKGTMKVIYDDYYIIINGKHEKLKDDKGKLHINIIDYTVKPVLRGGVQQPEYSNLVFSNENTCDNRVKLLEEITRTTVMDALMNKYMQNLKNFHKHVAVVDMHYKFVPE